ncbi:MAG TPA: hypothetical protein VGR45_00670 [Stellaceae bacterium]|nr:hypothetical protein [Stellaceae bacterium]
MNLLPATTIAGAVSATVTPWVPLNGTPRNLSCQANFIYGGSGGTNVDVFIQTSLDGKLTATDVAHFQFGTLSARYGCNITTNSPLGTPLSSATVPDKQTPNLTLTDGSMSANTAADGLLGPYIRVKYSSSGTYSAGTSVQVDVQSADIPAFP